MKKRIEAFSLTDLGEFQDDINEFLENTPGKLHDVKFSCVVAEDGYEVFNAILIYTPDYNDDDHINFHLNDM